MEYDYKYKEILRNNMVKDNIVDAYAFESYFIINNSIRRKRISKTIYNAIAHIISIIDRMPGLPEDTVIYRALNNECYENLDIGESIIDEAFTSFTISETMGNSMTSNATMESILPKGTKFIYIGAEYEILTYPGVKYTIEDKTTIKVYKVELPKYYVDLESIYNLDNIKSYVDESLDNDYKGIPNLESSEYYTYIVEKLNLEEYI
ncbi:Hypothetical protein ORPV_677 [Orpheovirus IHUMI-LCC2]|uniref:Uncharacterized protein n=1 Tax=Orpheovirus IHUMI-LCC2 TaxID=2023057 RepID=A0A2I2L4Z1_9VIRU|nr:Hypothetical protein ORPV_677 [Orpheovirus IHUMI-LCC2]SNW62581.1 Hypothetical protein ORPV_677 [Orpheovirus IHUMI-LCC2]